MKRIVAIILMLVICFSFILSADGGVQIYVKRNGNVEICVRYTNLTDSDLERVIHAVENYEKGIDPAQTASTYNLLCQIFGHTKEYSKTIVYHHFVYDTYPYCDAAYYDVEVCTRCAYENTTYTGSERVGCCTK